MPEQDPLSTESNRVCDQMFAAGGRRGLKYPDERDDATNLPGHADAPRGDATTVWNLDPAFSDNGYTWLVIE